jgi:hypothetical protein
MPSIAASVFQMGQELVHVIHHSISTGIQKVLLNICHRKETAK